MKKHNFWFAITAILLMISSLATAQSTALPYFTSFEDEVMGVDWQSKKRSNAGETDWYIGSAEHRMGEKSLYISADGGVTSSYTSSTGYTVVAYKTFNFATAGTYSISFDYYIGGTGETNGALRLSLLQSSESFLANNTAGWPNYATGAKGLLFTDSKTNNPTLSSSKWASAIGNVAVTTPGEYNLIFSFLVSSDQADDIVPPGACIDNLQIGIVPSSTDCNAAPTSIRFDYTSYHDKAVLTWSGNAPKYELMYYSVHSSTNTTYYTANNITTGLYEFPFDSFKEGVYTFLVRAICSDGTPSTWAKLENQMFFNPTLHCINYIDIHSDKVKCYSGKNGEILVGGGNVGVIDNGPNSIESIHTVHYDPNEYDRLTGYGLKTVPDGYMASTRIGTWKDGNRNGENCSVSARMEYIFTPSTDKDVLLINYAAVLQYGTAHPAAEQTSIKVQVYEGTKITNNAVPIRCAEVDFNARDVTEGNTRGWRTYTPTAADGLIAKKNDFTDELADIKWLDWGKMGMNLTGYGNRPLTIRITLSACAANYHFAYAYFTFDCIPAELEGVSCGHVEEKVSAPEGFKYEWYAWGDNKKILSTDREFHIGTNNTNSYYVKVISYEDPKCYFTLNVFTTARVPKASYTYTVENIDCKNVVTFTSTSQMGVNNPNGTFTPDLSTDIDYILWDFGPNYPPSTENEVTLTLPSAGITLPLTLSAYAGGCDDVLTEKLKIDSVGGYYSREKKVISEDMLPFEYKGETYTEAGTYEHTKQLANGCDSVYVLDLEVVVADFIDEGEIHLCTDMLPYNFHGLPITEEGEFSQTIYDKQTGYPIAVYTAKFNIDESLAVDLRYKPEELIICNDDGSFDLPFTVVSGILNQYSITFDKEALKNGFTNVPVRDLNGDAVKVMVPYNVRPDRYKGTLTFINEECGNVDIPLNFIVRYPVTTIKQLWNDVLAIRKSDEYEFTSVQWYCDGKAVESHSLTSTQHYIEGQDLEFGKPYYAVLTRVDDNHAVPTCFYEPVDVSQRVSGTAAEMTTLAFTDKLIPLEVPADAIAAVYNVQGNKIFSFTVQEGENMFRAPSIPGIYVLHLIYSDGTTEAIKFMVKY